MDISVADISSGHGIPFIRKTKKTIYWLHRKASTTTAKCLGHCTYVRCRGTDKSTEINSRMFGTLGNGFKIFYILKKLYIKTTTSGGNVRYPPTGHVFQNQSSLSRSLCFTNCQTPDLPILPFQKMLVRGSYSSAQLNK